jgi:hypothetical protein
VTTADVLAVRSGRKDGRLDVQQIRAIELGAGGVLIFKHGPVGLAITDASDDVEIVRT